MKQVKISYEWWVALVEIDDIPETYQYMEDQLLFWSGGEDRIDREDGDVESAYLRMLGEAIITKSTRLTVQGIIRHFAEAEGWVPLDGSFGIRLVTVDTWEFESDEFLIQELD